MLPNHSWSYPSQWLAPKEIGHPSHVGETAYLAHLYLLNLSINDVISFDTRSLRSTSHCHHREIGIGTSGE